MTQPNGERAWNQALERLRAQADVAELERRIAADRDRTLETQVDLSEIPAPPFQEEARARRMSELMREAGLAAVRTDEVGNVTGWWNGASADTGSVPRQAALVVSAHLDTVFPEGTDVRVTRDGDRLRGPGISDDARGLATLLSLARALTAVGVEADSRPPLLFAATVGEEGAGDLRGVKHLFAEGGAARGSAGFVSLDGAGLDRIVTRGIGSRRFRIEAQGPGGHSWVDWGTPNPIHTLAGIAARLTEIRLPDDPVATLTIACWGGGTSINAIPQAAWLELDTRSERDDRLAELEAEIRAVVVGDRAGGTQPSTTERRASYAEGGLPLTVLPIGFRPGGATPSDAPLVQAALAATRARERTPELAGSSTDANIPMALGIPAITLGCGGEAGRAHTTDEWYRDVGGVDGVVRALHTILLATGYAPAPRTTE